MVGTIREIKDSYLHSEKYPSIGSLTRATFDEAVTVVGTAIEKICGVAEAGRRTYTGAEVLTVLNTLCTYQFVRDVGRPNGLFAALQAANILRPVEDHYLIYEFNSFVTEVAVRALIGKPAPVKEKPQSALEQPKSTLEQPVPDQAESDSAPFQPKPALEQPQPLPAEASIVLMPGPESKGRGSSATIRKLIFENSGFIAVKERVSSALGKT